MLLGLGHELGTGLELRPRLELGPGLELRLGLELGMGIDIVRQVNRCYMENGLVGRSDMTGDKGGVRRIVRIHLKRNTENNKKPAESEKKKSTGRLY